MTDFPHPDAPEFAPIRAELARLFITRKADLGLAGRADADIEAGIDSITWFLLHRIGQAMLANDTAFLMRFGWMVDAFNRLDAGERVVPLDG